MGIWLQSILPITPGNLGAYQLRSTTAAKSGVSFSETRGILPKETLQYLWRIL